MDPLSVKIPKVPREGRRAEACLRACEGIPTPLLEGGIILRLIAACVHLPDRRVREVLEELVVARLRQGEKTPVGTQKSEVPAPASPHRVPRQRREAQPTP